jgi:hypothetical protein
MHEQGDSINEDGAIAFRIRQFRIEIARRGSVHIFSLSSDGFTPPRILTQARRTTSEMLASRAEGRA